MRLTPPLHSPPPPPLRLTPPLHSPPPPSAPDASTTQPPPHVRLPLHYTAPPPPCAPDASTAQPPPHVRLTPPLHSPPPPLRLTPPLHSPPPQRAPDASTTQPPPPPPKPPQADTEVCSLLLTGLDDGKDDVYVHQPPLEYNGRPVYVGHKSGAYLYYYEPTPYTKGQYSPGWCVSDYLGCGAHDLRLPLDATLSHPSAPSSADSAVPEPEPDPEPELEPEPEEVCTRRSSLRPKPPAPPHPVSPQQHTAMTL